MSIISFGAGVNSTAMTILLVNEGWRGPIVFADTGTEWLETYCFMDYFERVWLKPRGLEMTRLGVEWRTKGHELTLIEYCEHYRTTPFPGLRWCTDHWKREPIQRWCNERGNPEQLIGIAADESHRRKGRACPLIDRGITRQGCIDIIQKERLDVPQKSGCYICPFQRKSQWAELWRRHPELYARAENLERLSSERRGKQTHIRPGSDFTLAEFRLKLESQMSFLDDAEMDGLLEYKPCVCGL